MVEGSVQLQRTTYAALSDKAREAQQLWCQPRRFFIPASEVPLQTLADLGPRLVLNPPALQPGPPAPFEPVTVSPDDLPALAEFIVLAIEAGRSDMLKQVTYPGTASLSQPCGCCPRPQQFMPPIRDRIMKPTLHHPPKRTILLLAVVILLSNGCQLNQAAPTANPAESPSPVPTEAITVYFTDPTDPAASSYRGGVDEILAAAIGQAQAAVDLAMYDLNLWSLRDALIAAHQRGVSVRMVTESDNLDEPEMQELREAGIEVLGDRREGLMHNKFVIIDRWEVWTGSTNFTTGGVYRNDNNLVRIRSIPPGTRLHRRVRRNVSKRCLWAWLAGQHPLSSVDRGWHPAAGLLLPG